MVKTKGTLRLDQLIVSRAPARNPRVESRETLQPLIDSMGADGQFTRIIVVETDIPDVYEVAAGNRRVQAARVLNWELIDVEVHDSWPQTVQVMGAMGANDVVEVRESGRNMQTGELVTLMQDSDTYAVGVVSIQSEKRAMRLFTALEPLIMNPVFDCTSCDDKGCGFCVPNEPHGQPTE